MSVLHGRSRRGDMTERKAMRTGNGSKGRIKRSKTRARKRHALRLGLHDKGASLHTTIVRFDANERMEYKT